MKRPTPARTPARQPPGEVRIIGGLWKRSKLAVAVQEGLRPTPERVRETLFNWLGQDLSGLRCLDAFAGSGALGFEAASRGAARVLLIERTVSLAATLRANAQRLGAAQLEVCSADALLWMRQHLEPVWDVIFLDPPFGGAGPNGGSTNEPLFAQALQAAKPLLAQGGLIYLEAPRAWTAEELLPLGLVLHRQGRAGQVFFHLLQAQGQGGG